MSVASLDLIFLIEHPISRQPGRPIEERKSAGWVKLGGLELEAGKSCAEKKKWKRLWLTYLYPGSVCSVIYTMIYIYIRENKKVEMDELKYL